MMPNGLGNKNRDFVSEYITSNTSFFTVPLHVKYLRRSLDILSMPNSLGKKEKSSVSWWQKLISGIHVMTLWDGCPVYWCFTSKFLFIQFYLDLDKFSLSDLIITMNATGNTTSSSTHCIVTFAGDASGKYVNTALPSASSVVTILSSFIAISGNYLLM